MVSFFKGKGAEEKRIEHWYEERVGRVTLQRNVLIMLMLGTLIVLVLSLSTLFAVSTSRTVEPFMVEVSRKTGAVAYVNPATVTEYSANRAVANFFATQYAKARELFHPATYRYNYYTLVRVFSDSNTYSSFRSALNVNNVDSPLNKYSNVVDSQAEVKLIRHLDASSVQIRLWLTFSDRDGRKSILKKLISIKYKYSDVGLSEEDRLINPLGFIVVSYQVDDDYT